MKKVLLSLLLSISTLTHAWEPTKPINVIIGFGPGSGNEIGFRVLAEEVSKNNPKFTYTIELKPGADTIISSNLLYESKPDGYTIAIPSYMPTFVTNDIWLTETKKWKYDEFSYVMGMGKSPMAIVANPNSTVNNGKELLEYVKNTKKPVSFATGGGAHQMVYEYIMLNVKGDKDLVKYIPHAGPLQAVTAVASNAGIEFGIMPVAIARPLIDAGRVKLVAISGDTKLGYYPNVDPLIINGKGVSVMAAWAMMLPPNTPKEITDWYQREFSKAVQSQAAKKYYKDNLIYIVEDELTTVGLLKHVEVLRNTWLPLKSKLQN